MKNILVISYYWPPAGGIGVLRCLKLVKYLKKLNFNPIVCTPENPSYFYRDNATFQDIPENLKIIKSKIWEPYKIFRIIAGIKKEYPFPDVFTEEKKPNIFIKLGIWIRGNFFIPDARCFWIKNTVRTISDYLENNTVDLIVSNGPPHSAHMIALELKKKYNIPWLADFQDPWTQADYFEKLKLFNFSKQYHSKMEQEIFKWADKITICSKNWKSDLEQIGAKNVEVVYWGYDPEDYAGLKRGVTDKFILGHFGRIGPDRNPHLLWEVLCELCKKVPDFKEDLLIDVAGEISHAVRLSLEENGLGKNVRYHKNLPRYESLQMMKNSSILLLLINDWKNSAGRIPGKMFEYIAVKRPIIVLGPKNSEAAELIKRYKSGYGCDFQDYDEIRNSILDSYKKFKSSSLNDIETDTELFSNINTTKSFINHFQSVWNNGKTN